MHTWNVSGRTVPVGRQGQFGPKVRLEFGLHSRLDIPPSVHGPAEASPRAFRPASHEDDDSGISRTRPLAGQARAQTLPAAVCDHAAQIRDAIVDAIDGLSDCGNVTDNQLG